MVSKNSPLVKYLGNLREFGITFGLHQKKQTPVSFTLDRAISRIQDVYDFDCQCVNQVKAFLGTTAQTQGFQGTVSTVVLEDGKRILQTLMDIKDLLSQHAPQLLEVFKMKSLLTLICENFFSEMRAGSLSSAEAPRGWGRWIGKKKKKEGALGTAFPARILLPSLQLPNCLHGQARKRPLRRREELDHTICHCSSSLIFDSAGP